jgi:hypothetical protein
MGCVTQKYKNYMFPKADRLSCPRYWGAEALHFLVEHFSFLGFDRQYWMLIVLAIAAGSVLVALGAGRLN